MTSSKEGSAKNLKDAPYTDNGNGTATDNVTGLVWEVKVKGGGIHDPSATCALTSTE